jgi:4-hydroxy-3-polyprenylbenzoate decarboxylase
MPLVVGMTGASGAIYAKRLLEILKDLSIPTHLVISHSAEITIAHETNFKVAEFKALASVVATPGDIAASIASGSFPTRGMIIAPCSIRSMSEIASGVTSSLLSRAADVTLKERRRLVLMVRETPLHVGHLRTMTQLAEMGAIIAPPVPAFYARPVDLAEMIDHTVGRVLDLFEIDSRTVRRWTRDRQSPTDHRIAKRTCGSSPGLDAQDLEASGGSEAAGCLDNHLSLSTANGG